MSNNADLVSGLNLMGRLDSFGDSSATVHLSRDGFTLVLAANYGLQN